MKRRGTTHGTIARALALAALACACASAAAAQSKPAKCTDAGLQSAVADPSDQTISLLLFPGISSKDQAVAANPSQWTLVDIAPQPPPPPSATPTPTPLRVTEVELAADSLHPDNFLSATVHYVGKLERGGRYVLSNVALTFNGCTPPSPPSTRVTFDSVEVKQPQVFTRAKAKNRDEADIYLSGQLEGTHKTRAKQTADIKVELPFSRGNLFGRQRDVVPFFHLKTSNAKKADADTMNFGVMLRTVYNVGETAAAGKSGGRFLTNLAWETDGRVESDRRFGNVNALWGNTLYFIPRVFGARSNKPVLVFIQPFLGAELGRNLKSPLEAARHRGLARATGGANLYLNFNSGRRLLDALSFETDYIRRWPLRREVSFTEDDKGKLLPLVTGRSPRDYVTSKMEVGVNDYFGFTVGYDYGRLPPNYKLVDSHFTFGITYKQRLIPRIK